ncbi:MAG: DJ-1/PfpI family protein [Chloroflexota bacterium]
MDLAGAKVAILMESDFYEHEIWYYHYRFAEEGIDARFVSKLWGQPSLTFKGHEYHAPFECHDSFESIDDAELDTYSAVIVPSGMVSDRLRWTEDVTQIPDATRFLSRAFARPNIIKGIICHGLWLTAPMPELVRGRRLTCHNNLHGDALAYGATYVDQDVVEDGDLITGRSGGHAHLFARAILDRLRARRSDGSWQSSQPLQKAS